MVFTTPRSASFTSLWTHRFQSNQPTWPPSYPAAPRTPRWPWMQVLCWPIYEKISQKWPYLRGLLVRTTPKLKSSAALGRCAVMPPLMTAAWEPHEGWNSSRFSRGCCESHLNSWMLFLHIHLTVNHCVESTDTLTPYFTVVISYNSYFVHLWNFDQGPSNKNIRKNYVNKSIIFKGNAGWGRRANMQLTRNTCRWNFISLFTPISDGRH